MARQWNEALLGAIRQDFARPTVHARNLYHVSAAMWDAWAAFDPVAQAVFHQEKLVLAEPKEAREEAISYAAFHVLSWRFARSPGAAESLRRFEDLMRRLGYDPDFHSTEGPTPAALGNRVAQTVIREGLDDGSNERGNYANQHYQPANRPLLPALPGNPGINDPNRWQPLALDTYIDQAGRVLPVGEPEFLSAEWGAVKTFALRAYRPEAHPRSGFDYFVYHDPGAPPRLGSASEDEYQRSFAEVAAWSGLLDPHDGVMLDISPAARGNNTLGANDGHGHVKNPHTGEPYASEQVPAGDYYRVLAEFWADGPDSETPPGHWFAIANAVADHPAFGRRLRGQGPALDALEWDVKVYLALGGAMLDAAVAAWGVKGWYDSVRPVSAVRYLCDNGQSSDPALPSWNPAGMPLRAGSIEVITVASSAPGGPHAHLAQADGRHIGKIALFAWRGPDFILDPATDQAGVGWIRCENWWPYQRPTFVTPPFAGYVSGHSAYSRAAAEVLTRLTGDAYFPGGLATFHAPRNEFLVFEEGPSVDVDLQWATYYDAADECGLSRIYGGIHPYSDDLPGRIMGARVGADAVALAMRYFGGEAEETPVSPSPREGVADRPDAQP